MDNQGEYQARQEYEEWLADPVSQAEYQEWLDSHYCPVYFKKTAKEWLSAVNLFRKGEKNDRK